MLNFFVLIVEVVRSAIFLGQAQRGGGGAVCLTESVLAPLPPKHLRASKTSMQHLAPL